MMMASLSAQNTRWFWLWSSIPAVASLIRLSKHKQTITRWAKWQSQPNARVSLRPFPRHQHPWLLSRMAAQATTSVRLKQIFAWFVVAGQHENCIKATAFRRHLLSVYTCGDRIYYIGHLLPRHRHRTAATLKDESWDKRDTAYTYIIYTGHQVIYSTQ